MAGLKNRRTACLVMCVMILISLPIGAYASGSRLYSHVEDMFYNGERGNGVGVASDLSGRANAAMNLATVAQRYVAPGDGLVQPVLDACNEVSMASTLEEKKQADEYLAKAMAALYDGMGELSLSDKDEGYRSSLYADFTSYGSTMSHDGYNQAAAQYNRQLDAFPGRIFFSLLGFDEAPIFR